MSPVLLAVLAVALLLVLVLGLRLHAFVALLLTSLAVAVAGGMPLAEITSHVQQAMGATLGYIAIIVGLGAIFGEVFRRTGAAERMAVQLLDNVGAERAPWALGATGLMVAIPVFFDVAFVLFVPLLRSLAARSGRTLTALALPLLAGLAVGHAFVPPTPGPVAVAGLLGADLGWVIFFGLLAGAPALVLGGVVAGTRLAARIEGAEGRSREQPRPEHAEEPALETSRPLPTFILSASLVLLPLALILASTVAGVVLEKGHGLRTLLQFIGHPMSALLLATLLAFYLLGTRGGFSRIELQQMATRSLEPVGLIILVTGAGGVLGKTLAATGAGDAVAGALAASKMPLVVLAFLLAAAVRLAQGSATVSMVTAAGLVAPVVETTGASAPLLAAITLAIAGGATVLSHVNDSGFWLVSKYLGLSEKETLQTWTVVSGIVGGTGFLVVALISLFV